MAMVTENENSQKGNEEALHLKHSVFLKLGNKQWRLKRQEQNRKQCYILLSAEQGGLYMLEILFAEAER